MFYVLNDHDKSPRDLYMNIIIENVSDVSLINLNKYQMRKTLIERYLLPGR